MARGSLRRAQAGGRARLVRTANLGQLGHLRGQPRGVALERQEADLVEELGGLRGVEGLAAASTIFSARVGCGRSNELNSSSWSFSPGRRPTTSMLTSRPGTRPDSSIMSRARSMILTGSPISRTYTAPRSASDPARTISCTASGIVMK